MLFITVCFFLYFFLVLVKWLSILAFSPFCFLRFWIFTIITLCSFSGGFPVSFIDLVDFYLCSFTCTILLCLSILFLTYCFEVSFPGYRVIVPFGFALCLREGGWSRLKKASCWGGTCVCILVGRGEFIPSDGQAVWGMFFGTSVNDWLSLCSCYCLLFGWSILRVLPAIGVVPGPLDTDESLCEFSLINTLRSVFLQKPSVLNSVLPSQSLKLNLWSENEDSTSHLLWQ